jgi:MFS family permease
MGLSQGQVGLLMAVVPLVLAILNPISGVLSDRVGTRPVSIVGLILLVFGYLALTRLNTSSTVGQYLIYLLPVGLGMGTFQSPNNTSIMSAVPRNRLGVASGTLSMTRTLGQTAGIAVLGAYFVSRLQVYAGQAVDITTASANAIVEAMHDEFIVVAGLIAIGLVVALWQWRVEARAGRNE